MFSGNPVMISLSLYSGSWASVSHDGQFRTLCTNSDRSEVFGLDLRQWIKAFCTDISSCVLNIGYASKHFHLERGVRQGCPLSGTLFVIAIKLLAQSIRRSKEIKGTTIDEHNEVKLSQYADGTTVLLSDVQSASKLFDL